MFDINLSQLLPPIPEDSNLVTHTVLVNGQIIPDQFEVTQILIHRRFNRIPFAIIQLLDSGVASQQLEVSDQDIWSPGNEIEIKVGYHSDENTLFKGMILKHGIKVKSGESSRLEIECKDMCVKMTVGRKNRYFTDLKDSELTEQIINESYAGDITTEIEDSGNTHAHMVQYFASDWDFIVSRADANAQLVLPKDGTLEIKKPQFDQEKKFVLNYGTSIYEFEAEMDARDQYPAARAVSWNLADQDVSIAEASSEGTGLLGGSGFGGFVNNVADQISGGLGLGDPNTDYTEVMGIDHYLNQHSGSFTNEELQAWATAQFQKSTLSKSKGRVRFEGVADVYPGDSIELQNVGARHSGKVFVTAVKQVVAEGAWFSEIQFGLPHCWFGGEFDDIQDKPAANLLPAVNGLQIGLVTKIDGDPEGQDRIMVRLPLVDINAEGIWARVACQDAGAERGAYFRPEPDDEVIIGFINDDPRSAIVLGMLNSSSKPAPITATEENHEKGWVTRSGVKFIFNDDKKSCQIDTPKGKKILIDDEEESILLEDDHGNKVILNSDGIAIESSADLHLKAQGDIQMEAMNIKQKANQGISSEGNSKVELKSSADVVINGTFVRIN